MSKQIDERVVKMQFDNSHFEKNVGTTMSTLDKLKQKLHFKDADQGLKNINDSAKKVDMSPLAKSVEVVKVKFSALQVMGVTALTNITNSALNAGKRIASALTIDPVRTGFQEYETQMNAVQTILANTQSKGSTLEDVNKALDDLNVYADKTIYNFTEMTRNIGTFTAAGVELQTSVDSIKGIANLAAVSGSTSQQASTAMYQLSQALAAGKVSLMDWNSVVNAGMGGELFQNALLRTSELLKTGGKEAVKTYGSFRESLTKGEWLTTEVLTETLKQLSGAYTEADLIAQGFTQEQAKEIAQLAQTATDAATKVKTFSQLWDVMKESAQSGWAQTWKLIIGDFEEAKALLTPLAEFFTGAITKMSEARNKLLESALGKSFTGLAKKISAVAEPVTKTADAVSKAGEALEDLGKIADKVILGEFGNGKKRFDALSEAGYNYYAVQNKVNEKLGNSYRYSEDLAGAQKGLTKEQNKAAESTSNVNKVDAKRIEQLAALSDAELKELGYTNEQISAFRELATEADRVGMSISDFIDNIDNLNGRWLLINSFKNIGGSIVKIFKAIGNAWKEVFPPMTSDGLYNLIAGFHKLSTKLSMSDETADKLKRTFKGLFSIIKIIFTLVGGPLKIAFKVLSTILEAFDLNILDLTAYIGDAITNFSNWLDSTFDLTAAFDKILPYVKNAIKGIKDWIEVLKNSDNIPRDIFLGLVNGLKNGFSTIGSIIWELGGYIIEKIKGVLGIHSPSTEFFEIGKNIIQGLVNGVKWGYTVLKELFSSLGDTILEIVKNINLENIIAVAISGGIILSIVKIFGILNKVASAFEGIGEMTSSIGNFFNDLGEGIKKKLKADSLEKKSKAIRNLAISIGILTAAAVVLGNMERDKLIQAGIALLGMAAVITILAFVAKKIGKDGGDLGKLGLTLIGFGISLSIMASAMKKLEFLNESNIKPIVGGVVAIGAILLAAMYIGKMKVDTKGMLSMFLGLSIALYVMTSVLKKISQMDETEIDRGLGVITAFSLLIMGMMAINKLPGAEGSAKGLGGMLLGFAAALLVMILVIKLINKMSPSELKKGLTVIGIFGLIISGLMAATKLMGTNAVKGLGTMLLGVAAALLAMALCVKMLGGMDEITLLKGLGCVGAFGALIAVLIVVAKSGGNDLKHIWKTLLAVSACIAILAAIAIILGLIPVDVMAQGVIAVSILGSIMALLINVTKNAKDSMKNIIAITVAIAVMTAAVVVLSYIDPNKLVPATAAVGSLMYILNLIIKNAGKAKDAMAPLLAISLLVGVLGGVLWLVGQMPVANALASAGALSIVLGVMAGVLIVLGKMKVDTKKANKGVVGLYLIVVALYGVAEVLLKMNGVENAIENSVALSIILINMTGIIAVLSTVNANIGSSLKGVVSLLALCVPLLALVGILAVLNYVDNVTENINALCKMLIVMVVMVGLLALVGLAIYPAIMGCVAVLALCVPLVAVVGILYLMEGLEKAKENTEVLTSIMDALGKLLIVLAIAGPLALVGVVAVYALITLITIVGVLAVAIGALFELCPSLQKFLESGLVILIAVAYAIGEMVGAFIAGAITQIADALPNLGTQLSLFATNLQPFVIIMSSLPEGLMGKVGSLVGSILLLAAADLIAAILEFLGLGGGFAQLGSDLSAFAINAMPFFAVLSTVDPASLEAVKCLAEAIMILTAADLVSAIAEFFGADVSFADFGAELPTLGQGLAGFRDGLGDFSQTEVDIVKSACEAIKYLAEAAGAIPNEGGWAGKIFGENNLGKFADDVKKTGPALRGFVEGLGDWTEEDSEKVRFGAEAVKAFAEASDAIGNEGGVAAFFAGDNSLGKFAADIAKTGLGLRYFVDALGTNWGEKEQEKVKWGAEAVKAFAEASDAIGNEGGVAAFFAGDNSLGKFAKEIEETGACLVSFCNKVKEIDSGGLKAFDNAFEMFARFSDAARYSPNEDERERLEDLAEVVGDDIADSLSDWYDEIGSFTTGEMGRADAVCYVLEKFADTARHSPNKDERDRLEGLAETVFDVGGELNGWWDEIGSFTGGEMGRADAACYVLEKFANVAKSTPNGDQQNQLVWLAENTTKVGEHLNGWYDEIGSFTTGEMERTDAACYVLNKFAGVAESIGGKTGATMATFAGNVKTTGTNLNGLWTAIGQFGTGTKERATAVCDVMKTFSTTASSLPNGETISNLPKFAASIYGFIQRIQSGLILLESMSTETANTAIANIKSVITSISEISVPDTSKLDSEFSKVGSSVMSAYAKGLTSGKENVKTAGVSVVTSLKTAMNDLLGKFKTVGSDLVKKFAAGIKSKDAKSSASSSAETIIKSMKTVMSNQVNGKSGKAGGNFESIGKNVVKGFANGIKLNKKIASDAAKEMAKAAIQAAKDELDQNSPSKEFMWIGGGVVEGFAKGITDDMKTVTNTGVLMAANIVTATKKELQINSPSKVFRDEVGKWIVVGIAEGIKADMSAEEQAAQKAKNIADAFKAEMDKLDLDSTTLDLELNLWKSINPSATADELAEQELNNLKKKLLNQEGNVEYAKGNWLTASLIPDVDPEEVQKLYNAYLQEVIDYNEIVNEINEKSKNGIVNQDHALQKLQDYKMFFLKEKETIDELRKTGFSDEDIDKWVREQTGYNPETSSNLEAKAITYLEPIENALSSVADDTYKSIISKAEKAVEGVRSVKPKAEEAGDDTANGILNSFMVKDKDAYIAGNTFGGSLLGGFKDRLGIQSPSKEMYRMGVFTIEGFMNALKDYQGSTYEAGSDVANSAKQGISDAISTIKNTIDSDMDTVPTIRPILDLTDIQNGVGRLNTMISTNRTIALAGAAGASVDQLRSSNVINVENAKIVDAISELRGDFNSLTEAISHMHIRMDSGAVVGELVGKIDTSLGRIATNRGRGN